MLQEVLLNQGLGQIAGRLPSGWRPVPCYQVLPPVTSELVTLCVHVCEGEGEGEGRG